MAKMNPLHRIKERAAELAAEMRELESAIQKKQEELEELGVAERVLNRMMPDDDVESDGGRVRETIGDKIVSLLTDRGAMRSHDILVALQTEWRSDVSFETISSTLSRIKSNGRVALDNDARLWSIPSTTSDSVGQDIYPATDEMADNEKASH